MKTGPIHPKEERMDCRLTVLCENSVAVPHGLVGEHGWAVHLDTGTHRLLLDTGQGLGLLNNSRALDIDLRRLDGIVISHGHYDHTSGLADVLTLCGEVAVSLCIETDDAGFLCQECNGRHAVTQKEILPISTLV